MNEPTSRQRSAVSDAIEILNELHDLGIPAETIIKAMDFTEQKFCNASLYLTNAWYAKSKEETE